MFHTAANFSHIPKNVFICRLSKGGKITGRWRWRQTERISRVFPPKIILFQPKLWFAIVCRVFLGFYAFLQNADVFLSTFGKKYSRNIHSLIHFILQNSPFFYFTFLLIFPWCSSSSRHQKNLNEERNFPHSSAKSDVCFLTFPSWLRLHRPEAKNKEKNTTDWHILQFSSSSHIMAAIICQHESRNLIELVVL